jgi:hypothetical protein
MIVHPLILCLSSIIGIVSIANIAKRRGVAAFTGPSFLLLRRMVHVHSRFNLGNTILEIADLAIMLDKVCVLCGVVGPQGANAVP